MHIRYRVLMIDLKLILILDFCIHTTKSIFFLIMMFDLLLDYIHQMQYLRSGESYLRITICMGLAVFGIGQHMHSHV